MMAFNCEFEVVYALRPQADFNLDIRMHSKCISMNYYL